MAALKLTMIGTSIGAIFPDNILARLNVMEGDELYLTEVTDGSYRLTSRKPAFGDKMEQAEDIMRRYRNTLDILAR